MNKIIDAAILKVASVIAALLLGIPLHAAQLTPEIQSAKEKGITLYNQYKDGERYLRVAAEAGDRESQYYLAEDLRHTARFMTPEAEKWYSAAAEQGDLYAMYRLAGNGGDLCTVMKNCPQGSKTAAEWFELGKQTAKLKADKGDAEAMYLLYFFRGGDEWLSKAAESGFPEANDYLATLYSEGRKFYFPPWKRSEKVGELLRRAAEGGYPPAMMKYAAYSFDSGNLSEARFWVDKAASLSYKSGVASLGAGLAHAPDVFGFPLDRVKGYALTSILLELDGGGNTITYANEVLGEISQKLTPGQIKDAEKIAQEWKATHPPLSFFPDKLDY